MNIPEELRLLKQWCVWRYEDTDLSKPTKVPYQAKGPHKASVNDASTWSTFEECEHAYKWSNGALAGIGFIFSENDPYAGIDLDATEDAALLARQQKVFSSFDSYSELSPSGKGLHIIIKAKLPNGRRRSSIELYSSNRFFTMTGNVYNDKPIADRQELAQVLYDEMGRVNNISNYLGTIEEKLTDAEVIEQALRAVNGDKFKTLLEGNWANIYPSQSEADFAFVDMVAFYTQSRNQIVRIFRGSALGQREKAARGAYVEYMLNRAFDRMLPPVDIEGLQLVLEEAKAKHLQQQTDLTDLSNKLNLVSQPNNPLNDNDQALVPQNPYQIPPGLLGEIAQFIYQSSPRQVPEIALAAAIALMAGITGRAYTVSNTGLNQYVLLLADTGAGKEAMASGITRLINSLQDEIPAIKTFIGPGEIASGQALLKYLSGSSQSFVSIIGEFGLKMQQLSSRHANASELMLKKVLLDLYNKTGPDGKIEPSIYSMKENNTNSVISPAVTLLGESTPSTFFVAIDENVIADGLLPRFTLIEYTGKRPPLNKKHALVKPSEQLKDSLATLAAYCLKLGNGVNSRPLFVEVKLTYEAETLADKFGDFADNKVNNTELNIIKHLWSRAYVKLIKLAALVAVGCDAFNPIIQDAHILWAKGIVEYDIIRLQERFIKGEFGANEHESRQHADMKRMFAQYLECSFDKIANYQTLPAMHKDKVIPYAFICKKLISLAAFRLDKMGSVNAIKKTLANFIDSGFIKEIGRNDLNTRYNTSQRAFMVTDMSWILG